MDLKGQWLFVIINALWRITNQLHCGTIRWESKAMNTHIEAISKL